LRFAVRELSASPILVVGTYRDAAIEQDPARKLEFANLHRESVPLRIDLPPLTARDTRRFLEKSAAETPDLLPIAATLHERCGGNPFFLTQLVGFLRSQSQSIKTSETSIRHTELPAGLREAITQQLADVPRPTRDILKMASVIGASFRASLLADVMHIERRRVATALEPALTREIIAADHQIPGAYRFSHILLRDALYAQIPLAVRQQIHGTIAQSLEESFRAPSHPHAAEIAHHLCEAADPAAARKAILYSTRAAEWAAARHAYEDSPRHMMCALRAFDMAGLTDPEYRCELLIRLAEAHLAAGDSEEAKTTISEAARIARETGSSGLLVRCALAITPRYYATDVGRPDPLLGSILEEALSRVVSNDATRRSQLAATLAISLVWNDAEPRRKELTEEALRLARRAGDPKTVAYALSARHGVLWHPKYKRERANVIRELGSTAGVLRSPEVMLVYRLFHLTYLLEMGDVLAADREISRFSREAEEFHLPHFLWQTKLLRATRLLMVGRFKDAEREANAFLEIGARAELDNAIHSYASHFAVNNWERGRTASILSSTRALVERYPAVLGWRCGLAYFLADGGDLEAARSEFETIAARGLGDLPRNENWRICLDLLADVACRLNDVSRANELFKLLLPASGSYVVVGFSVVFWGSQDRTLGNLAACLGNRDTAMHHFKLALRKNADVRALPWLAHTHHDYSRFLRSLGDPDGARAHESLATELCEKLGMIRLASTIRERREGTSA
jgi:tetratricopeptide (TPR) repeat protein